MDILQMRIPEYYGRACAERIPVSYAVKKSEHIESTRKNIEKIDAEINQLRKKLDEVTDTESFFYQNTLKRLKKCYEIKRNCEASIVLAREQMKINKR